MLSKRAIRTYATLLLALVAATPLYADGHPFELRVGSAAAQPGQRVEIAVEFNPGGAAVSAMAFYVEYDAGRLVYEPPDAAIGPKADDQPFRSAYARIESGDRSMIGICIYDPDVPLSTLSTGPIAKMTFRVAEGATGFAQVTISRDVDGSDPVGGKLDTSNATITGGGVSITAPGPTAQTHVSEHPL